MSHHHDRLDPRRWARVRRAAFDRDEWKCTACGSRGRLEAHHVIPLERGGAPYGLANVATMCRSCHIKHHRHDDGVEGRDNWLRMMEEMIR